MSRFYGTLQGNRGRATRQGIRDLRTIAASWKGCIVVDLYIDGQDRDCFRISQDRWQGSGRFEVIAEGVIGETTDYSVLERIKQKLAA